MPDWQVEQGIGEERAILFRRGKPVAARIHVPGNLTTGSVVECKLVSKRSGSDRGTVALPDGRKGLVDQLPKHVTEGMSLSCEVRRTAIREANRTKLSLLRPTDRLPLETAGLLDELHQEGEKAQLVRRFEPGLWETFWEDAWSGELNAANCTLFISETPAMTLIDVDGPGASRQLAIIAASTISRCIARFNLSGSIGIDFPTLPARTERKQVDQALDAALSDIAHERTAMNGFGFVQVVTRKIRPSLIETIQADPEAAAARLLLRRAEHLEGAGTTFIEAHPAVVAALRSSWLDKLQKRSGRPVRLSENPSLALSAGNAQIVEQ